MWSTGVIFIGTSLFKLAKPLPPFGRLEELKLGVLYALAIVTNSTGSAPVIFDCCLLFVQVCYKTLNPVWKEEFFFCLTAPESSILDISVYDKDNYTKDDFIGR